MPWVSIREASEIFGVSIRTVRRLIDKKTLPSRLDGGLRLVLVGESQETVPAQHGEGASPEMLEHALGAYENLRALLEVALEHLRDSRVLDVINDLSGQEGCPGSKEWQSLAKRVVACFKRVEAVMENSRVEPDTIRWLYKEMLDVKHTWIRYVKRAALETEAKVEVEQRVDRTREILMDQIVADLRWLLIASA